MRDALPGDIFESGKIRKLPVKRTCDGSLGRILLHRSNLPHLRILPHLHTFPYFHNLSHLHTLPYFHNGCIKSPSQALFFPYPGAFDRPAKKIRQGTGRRTVEIHRMPHHPRPHPPGNHIHPKEKTNH